VTPNKNGCVDVIRSVATRVHSSDGYADVATVPAHSSGRRPETSSKRPRKLASRHHRRSEDGGHEQATKRRLTCGIALLAHSKGSPVNNPDCPIDYVVYNCDR
jgi:hypothetical protein